MGNSRLQILAGLCYFLWDAAVDTVCEEDLTAKIEILHLGWIMYSIVIWRVHKYYFCNLDPPQWPSQEDLPPTEHLFCGTIIQKCWDKLLSLAVSPFSSVLHGYPLRTGSFGPSQYQWQRIASLVGGEN